jgi:hypothetical protein
MERIGCFDVSDHLVFNHEKLAQVLAKLKFVPTSVKYQSAKGIFKYIGYSESFEYVSMGDFLPEYNIVVKDDEKGEVFEVFAKRICE